MLEGIANKRRKLELSRDIAEIEARLKAATLELEAKRREAELEALAEREDSEAERRDLDERRSMRRQSDDDTTLPRHRPVVQDGPR
jgi:hypothetical protein